MTKKISIKPQPPRTNPNPVLLRIFFFFQSMHVYSWYIIYLGLFQLAFKGHWASIVSSIDFYSSKYNTKTTHVSNEGPLKCVEECSGKF